MAKDQMKTTQLRLLIPVRSRFLVYLQWEGEGDADGKVRIWGTNLLLPLFLDLSK
jgi:hypothetical protein